MTNISISQLGEIERLLTRLAATMPDPVNEAREARKAVLAASKDAGLPEATVAALDVLSDPGKAAKHGKAFSDYLAAFSAHEIRGKAVRRLEAEADKRVAEVVHSARLEIIGSVLESEKVRERNRMLTEAAPLVPALADPSQLLSRPTEQVIAYKQANDAVTYLTVVLNALAPFYSGNVGEWSGTARDTLCLHATPEFESFGHVGLYASAVRGLVAATGFGDGSAQQAVSPIAALYAAGVREFGLQSPRDVGEQVRRIDRWRRADAWEELNAA